MSHALTKFRIHIEQSRAQSLMFSVVGTARLYVAIFHQKMHMGYSVLLHCLFVIDVFSHMSWRVASSSSSSSSPSESSGDEVAAPAPVLPRRGRGRPRKLTSVVPRVDDSSVVVPADRLALFVRPFGPPLQQHVALVMSQPSGTLDDDDSKVLDLFFGEQTEMPALGVSALANLCDTNRRTLKRTVFHIAAAALLGARGLVCSALSSTMGMLLRNEVSHRLLAVIRFQTYDETPIRIRE